MTVVNGISIGMTECVATVHTAVSAKHQRLTQIEYVQSVGGKWMKCFECGNKCVTVYYCGGFYWQPGDKITHVGKACPVHECGWESHPVKVPEPIN